MDCQVTLEPLCKLRQLTCSFEALIVVTLKVTSSWYVASHSSSEIYRPFVGVCYLRPEEGNNKFL